MTELALLVRQDDLNTSRIATRERRALLSGQIAVRIDAFALTANNITYAAFGDAMGYWSFFPSGEEGWGVVPAWGLGTVVQSLHPEVTPGEVLYGYWPMASYAVLQPTAADRFGLSDGMPHRASLDPLYNRYSRSILDAFHEGSGNLEPLLRPLFATSWLINDELVDEKLYGAHAVLMSSGSSKTAYGTAFLLARHGVQVIGLTSESNRAFCESLGCYERVLSYHELDGIASDLPIAYVDCAGNSELRRCVHKRFTRLAYSMAVGGTHWTELGGGRGLPGPRATRFFAPARAARRLAQWGQDEYDGRLLADWWAFTNAVRTGNPPWVVVQRCEGSAAVAAAYHEVLAGVGDPRIGRVLRL